MYKRLAFVLTIILVVLCLVFLGLDILDIAEGYRSTTSIGLFNTLFISLFTIPVIYFAARGYKINRMPEILGLNFAVFSFGLSVLVYAWFTGKSLNAHLASYDIGILLASVFHLVGMIYGKTRLANTKTGLNINFWAVIIFYLGIAGVIGLVTWLASSNIVVVTGTMTGDSSTRGIIHGIAVILMLAAAFVYLKNYTKKHADFYYWYGLGLVLLACGVFFITISQLEGRVAWSGRACQYVSSIYFLVAAVNSRKI
jgi:hypothetical protein